MLRGSHAALAGLAGLLALAGCGATGKVQTAPPSNAARLGAAPSGMAVAPEGWLDPDAARDRLMALVAEADGVYWNGTRPYHGRVITGLHKGTLRDLQLDDEGASVSFDNDPPAACSLDRGIGLEKHTIWRLYSLSCVGGDFSVMFRRKKFVLGDEYAALFERLRNQPPDDPKAVAAFETALADAQRGKIPAGAADARALMAEAERMAQDGKFARAAAFYRKAVTTAPGLPDAHYNEAIVLGELGRRAAAIRAMRRYLALSPNAPDAPQARAKIAVWESDER